MKPKGTKIKKTQRYKIFDSALLHLGIHFPVRTQDNSKS